VCPPITTKTTNMQPNGSETSSSKGLLHPVKLTIGTLEKSYLMTFADFDKLISSPVLADGRSPSDKQDG
jgi:hypothetical protein